MNMEVKETESQAAATIAREGKHLTFSLAEEEYGIDILSIKEIIGMMDVTGVPQTPEYVLGVINLRGKVIPVINLRIRFGLPQVDYTERTCIIVVEINKDGNSLLTGIVVDSVSEVMNISGDSIEPAPSFGSSLNTDSIIGMAKTEDKVIMLLDIDKVITTADINMI